MQQLRVVPYLKQNEVVNGRWCGHRGRRGCGCDSLRRVTHCAASTEARAVMAGGVRTARGVLPSATGSNQRSSVGNSRGGSSEPGTAVGARPNRAYAEWGSCSRSMGTVGRHECVRSSKQPPPYAWGCQSLTCTISYDVSHPWPPPFQSNGFAKAESRIRGVRVVQSV